MDSKERKARKARKKVARLKPKTHTSHVTRSFFRLTSNDLRIFGSHAHAAPNGEFKRVLVYDHIKIEAALCEKVACLRITSDSVHCQVTTLSLSGGVGNSYSGRKEAIIQFIDLQRRL